jgi:glycosyltransferase involved in cell wall biosynthesis
MIQAPVSIIILTYNEEPNIRFCLESVKNLTDEIFVVDSYSTDGTLEIVRGYTTKIYQNAWVDWAYQRNWALNNLPISYEWVLFLDADESLSDQLCQEIRTTLSDQNKSFDGYYIKRIFYFLGKRLKHSGYQADYILRLIKKDEARSIGSGAREYVTIAGDLAYLKHIMIHEDHKDIGFWIDKHNKLASLEARELFRLEAKKGITSKKEIITTKKIEHGKQIWLREKIWVRLPLLLRPFIYFLYRYVWQLGVLDGKEGFIICFLHGLWYQFLIDVKYLELRKGVKNNMKN